MTTTRLFAHFLGGNQTTFHASKQIDEKIQFIAPDRKKGISFFGYNRALKTSTFSGTLVKRQAILFLVKSVL